MIPLFDLNFDESEKQSVIDTLDSKWISMGPRVSEFETNFASLLESKYAVAISNCTVALHLAFKLLEIGDGDEVICPSLSFVATCNAILYTGAKPVFADIKSQDHPTIDPEEILRVLSPKTKAIIVMHYAGFPCDMERIMAIAKENNLKVIEDSCHAPLSRLNGKYLGTIGDVGCFSFFSNKNISTGEGGMLITNNEKYAKEAKLLRSHGMTTMSYERAKGHSTTYDVVSLGYNYRMDDIHAAIGLVQLNKLKEDLIKREKVRKLYIQLLSGVSGITIPFLDYSGEVSNYIFPIVLNDTAKMDRDDFRDALAVKGVQTSIHYPAIHRFSIYKNYSRVLSKTEQFSDTAVTLPMYGSLSHENVRFIVSAICEILN